MKLHQRLAALHTAFHGVGLSEDFDILQSIRQPFGLGGIGFVEGGFDALFEGG